jgi:hypothetical protein
MVSTKNTIILAASIFSGLLAIALCQRYELIAPSGHSQIFVIDRATGNVWAKFQQTNAGPSNWECIKQ